MNEMLHRSLIGAAFVVFKYMYLTNLNLFYNIIANYNFFINRQCVGMFV